LDLVALIADADARLIVREVVDAAVNVFIDDSAGLQERFFDVLSRFGGCLHKDKTVLAGKHLALVGRDLASGIQVTLISDQHDGHIGVSVLFDFFEPSCQVGESVSSRDVVDEKSTGRASVIRSRDRLKRFLASGVPDLQLNVFLLDLNGASTELNSNGQIVLLTEPLIRELEEETGFSDTYE